MALRSNGADGSVEWKAFSALSLMRGGFPVLDAGSPVSLGATYIV